MNQTDRLRFSEDTLKKMGLKPTFNRLLWLMGVASVENTKAKNNPFATTWNMQSLDPGQTNFNSAPVRNYSSWDIGVLASAKTFAQRNFYPTLLAALEKDISPLNYASNNSNLLQEFKTYGGVPTYWPTVFTIVTAKELQSFIKKKYGDGGSGDPVTPGNRIAGCLLIITEQIKIIADELQNSGRG